MDVRALERRLRPGVDSEAGFLGRTESLEDVLAEDAAALDELRLSHEELSGRLRQLLDSSTWAFAARDPRPDRVTVVDHDGNVVGEEELPPLVRPTDEEIEIVEGWRVRVAKRFDISSTRWFGVQRCPWSAFVPEVCERTLPDAASTDWEIENCRTGKRVAGPGLIVHLIAAHGFFEGRESPYRVDPHELAEVLELGPFADSPP